MHFYVYGGAFDPMTVGHESIIRHLIDYVTEMANQTSQPVYVSTIVFVTNNDEKNYALPFDTRRKLVEKCIANPRVTILPQKQRMAATLMSLIDETVKSDDFPGLTADDIEITLVMGYDEWASLNGRTGTPWLNADWILARCKFIVVDRPNVQYGYISEKQFEGRLKHVIWSAPCVSSTEVRRAMKFNPLYDGKDVPVVVAMELGRLGFLNQDDAEKHAEYEAAKLAAYSPKDWPKPSVTATTIIQYMNKVLLVRRLDFPYHDYWCFPGGFSNPHETIEEVGLREVREETGIDCIVPSEVIQLGIYTPKDPRDTKFDDLWFYDVGLMVDLTGRAFTQPKAGDDAKEAEWVDIEEVKNINLAFHHKKIFEAFLKRREVYNDRARPGKIIELPL